MQKKIIALAIAGLASSAAFAQSSVTLYGIGDVYYGHFNNAGQRGLNGVNSGGLSGSRIGVKGSEDLGNGLKAIFTAEWGFNIDQSVGSTSTSGETNGSGIGATRQSFVGLTGGFGTAVAGRLQTAGYDWACAYNPLGGSALDAQTIVGVSTLLTCGSNGRADNAVAYISPSFGGVTLAVNHARVSETQFASGSSGNNSYANLASVSYANGPVAAGLVFSRLVTSANAPTDDSLTEIGLGGSYDLQVVKLFANFQTADLNSAGRAGNRNNKFQVAAAVPVGAKAAVVLQAAKNNINNNTTIAETDSRAYTLAGTYSLSKRTTAYAGYTRVVNGEGAARTVAGTNLVTDAAASGLAIGLRHSF